MDAGNHHLRRPELLRQAKRRGFLRNVAVALGNSGDARAVPALAAALADPEPLVRGHAAWSLGRLGGAEARAALTAALPGETDAWVREEIELALSDPSDPTVLSADERR